MERTERLTSLDAFRGAVIAFMVLVNNGGGPESYAQLEHSKWNGWTLTDFVFPSFLWMVGISITLSFGKRLRSGVAKSALFRQILRRSLILIGLGLLVYLYPDFNFATMRFPGVLQRIGICYLVASSIYLTTGLRGQILWIAGLLLTYCLLMNFIPVPGYGTGRFDLEGNFAHFADRFLFGKHNYHGGDWDPEGSISTIPAVATTLLGMMAGNLLRWQRKLSKKLLWMCAIGIALTASGLVWSLWMPINKKLWTDSFALLNAGLDFIVFAIFAWLVDGVGLKRLVKPLVILGMNAIAVYMFAELLASTLDWIDVHDWAYINLFAPIASPLNASLLYAVGFVLVTYLFAYFLYRRNWFWRI
jgi:predicted acyltransferase